MSSFIKSSIGKKLLMSITGLFLIVFLLVHLGLNALIVFDSTGALFNQAAHFMGTSPIMKVMEPVLAAGFIVHIVYAFILTLHNMKARPVQYAVANKSYSSTWASKNMLVIGGLVLVFMAIHLANFFVKVKFTGGVPETEVNGEMMHDAYTLVTSLFSIWWYDLIYVVGAVLLGMHLTHGFWSAFQTLGLSNSLWRKRLVVVGHLYTAVVAGGFALIPLYVLIFG